ncbi:helix-turn-helix domain-containing protein [Limnoglobus roseus]|uniref:helix-turn-helix domain-containing protein n=1 Tax=Limnoglobus roseus TaxID=2598579 RepID=UPI0036F20CF5
MSRQLLTVRQAADILTVSSETVRQWFHNGRLTGIRVGRGIRIHTQSVTALLAEGARNEHFPNRNSAPHGDRAETHATDADC